MRKCILEEHLVVRNMLPVGLDMEQCTLLAVVALALVVEADIDIAEVDPVDLELHQILF